MADSDGDVRRVLTHISAERHATLVEVAHWGGRTEGALIAFRLATALGVWMLTADLADSEHFSAASWLKMGLVLLAGLFWGVCEGVSRQKMERVQADHMADLAAELIYKQHVAIEALAKDAEIAAGSTEARAELAERVAVLEAERLAYAEALATSMTNPAKHNSASSSLGDKMRPAPAPAALSAWWEWLGDASRALPEADLLDLCRAAFPRNSVSREAVRNLAGPRKRGPKPKICADSR